CGGFALKRHYGKGGSHGCAGTRAIGRYLRGKSDFVRCGIGSPGHHRGGKFGRTRPANRQDNGRKAATDEGKIRSDRGCAGLGRHVGHGTGQGPENQGARERRDGPHPRTMLETGTDHDQCGHVRQCHPVFASPGDPGRGTGRGDSYLGGSGVEYHPIIMRQGERTMNCRTGNYIHGKWVPSHSGKAIASINPARSQEIVGEIPDSDREDLNEAVYAARNAFPMWSGLSPVERGAFLQKAADILETRLEDIAVTATREMGKILPETKGEVLRGASILRYFAQEGMRQMGELLPSANRNNFLFSKRVPLGVVGVITPSNFPIAIPLWKVAPALIYGNTVVLKPAAETGVTACKIAEVFEEAGLPKGVFNLDRKSTRLNSS